MAAPFIRRRAAIMCHYPWAMIFLPLPTVVGVGCCFLLLSFKQHSDIYSGEKATANNKQRGDVPLQGYKRRVEQSKL